VAYPILLGDRQVIEEMIRVNKIELREYEIIDPRSEEEQGRREHFGDMLFTSRQRKGVTMTEARKVMRDRNYFGAMLVESGYADALISGLTRNYRNVIRPALQIIGLEEGVRKVAGMYIVQGANGPVFFADTTVNTDPTADELVEITLMVAKAVRRMRITPRIAMLSYSNFGSATGRDAEKMRQAVSILHRHHPELIVDGEVQANFALNREMIAENFPFSVLNGRTVNTLIFPNLAAGNIAYKLMQEMGEKEVLGPILLGMKRSFHILQMGSSVREIVNMVRIAVVDAQNK
jgi:malate dehydrogenase (oxaloacetate-decarboxylating)(NADP+)